MMKKGRLLIGAALLLAPQAALACTCDDAASFTASQVEKAARYLVDGGFVVAEVERVASELPGPYRYRIIGQRLGPRLGPIVLVGANAQRMADGTWVDPPVTSCDTPLMPIGTPRLIVLRPVRSQEERPTCGVLPKGQSTEWRDAGLCTGGLIDDPRILARASTLARAQAGVNRSSRPLSSSR